MHAGLYLKTITICMTNLDLALVALSTTHVVASMRLKVEELWLCEELSGCVDESVFVCLLVELTQLMVDGVYTRLTRLNHVAVSRHLYQDRTTQRAVKPEIHHLQQQHI